MEMDNLQNADGKQVLNQENMENNNLPNEDHLDIDLPIEEDKEIDLESHLSEDSHEAIENVDVGASTEAIITVPHKDYVKMSLEELTNEAQHLLDNYPIHRISKPIYEIREEFKKKLDHDKQEKLTAFLEEGSEDISAFSYDNPLRPRFNAINAEYKKRIDHYYKELNETQKQNLEKRLDLINRLKALYIDSNDSNSDIFKKFREIKTQWHNSGRIPKEHSSDVFKTYYHHLTNFYEYLDLNNELREMDYVHNLEVRHSILKRAEELIQEPSVQKALNELQYLHKLWKEEAVPVAEAQREPTWQKFKEITEQIHSRKQELTEKLSKEQQENLSKKRDILEKLNQLLPTSNWGHKEWQNAIKSANQLKEEFLAVGRVPKENTNETWESFKTFQRAFNTEKNNFYKVLKNDQSQNLAKKKALLQTAIDNKLTEDWQTGLEVFKKIQTEWKNIGHVPRSVSDKIWKEFKDACNEFFERYKQQSSLINDDWKVNYTKKMTLMESIRNEKWDSKQEDLLKKVNALNIQWTELGKVPRDKMNINREFSKLLKDKLAEAGINSSDIQHIETDFKINEIKANKDEHRLNDEIRHIKKQIQDIEHEIVQLDTNLSFFSNVDSKNPIFKKVNGEIEQKREKVKELKQKLRDFNAITFAEDEPSQNPEE